jgi:MSHA type pilus biogenesis protein MshL
MKSNIPRGNIAAPLALHVCGCALALMFGLAAVTASAAQKQPAFSDIPGVTPTNQPASNPSTFSPISEKPQPATTPPSATPPPPVTTPPPVVVQPPTSPPPAPAPAEEEMKEKTLYSFQATDLDLKSALAAFARANNLNIVPDNEVSGIVTLDVRDLPLKQIMRALLEANDCVWNIDGGLIRVHTYETRTFSVDYLRLSRKGIGYSSAVLASGSGSSGGTSGGGMSGGGGGGGGGGGMGGGGGSSGGTGGGSVSVGGSSINLTADNPIDFWKELKTEMDFLLTDSGKHTLAVNMTAGIVQVTDRPSALKRVEEYLKGVDRNIHRQVDLEAKIYDVTLNDQFQFGIDWVHVAEAYGGAMAFGGATLPVANGGTTLADSAIGGLNRLPIIGNALSTQPGNNLSSLVFTNFNTAAAINALSQQGNVEVVSKPRIRTLNNQTAMIKVGEDKPFFNSSSSLLQTSAGTTAVPQTTVSSVTIGTILSLTPQISDDEWVSLDISPVLTSLIAVVPFSGTGGSTGGNTGGGGTAATAPDLDAKQASTIVRVHDGNTVVIGGLIQTQEARNDTKIPVLGDIPLLGKLFTGTFRFKQKKELVIFVTPHIVREGMERPIPYVPDVLQMPHKP